MSSANQLHRANSEEGWEPLSSSTVERHKQSKIYISQVLSRQAAEAAQLVVNAGACEAQRNLKLNLESSPSDNGFNKRYAPSTQKSDQKLHILLTTEEEESADQSQKFNPVVFVEDQTEEQLLSESALKDTRQVDRIYQPFGEEASSSSNSRSSKRTEQSPSRERSSGRESSSSSSGVIAIVQRNSTAYVERLIKYSQQVDRPWAPPPALESSSAQHQLSHLPLTSTKAQHVMNVFLGEIPEEKPKRQLASASNSRIPLLEARKTKAFQFGSEHISPINSTTPPLPSRIDNSHVPQLPTSSRIFSRLNCSFDFNSAPGDPPKQHSGSKQEQRLFNNFSQKQFQSKTSKSSHTLTNQLSIFKADFGCYDKAAAEKQEAAEKNRQLAKEARIQLKSAPAGGIDKTAASFSLQSLTLQNRLQGTSDENSKDELIRQLQAQVQLLQEGPQAKMVESLKRKVRNMQVVIEAQQNFINQVQSHLTKGSVENDGESGQAVNSAFLNSLKNSLNNTLEQQRLLIERESLPFTSGGIIPDSQLEEPLHFNLERHSGQLLSLPLQNFEQFPLKSSEQEQFCTLTGADVLPGSGLPGSGMSLPMTNEQLQQPESNIFMNQNLPSVTETSNQIHISTNMSPIRYEYEQHPMEGCVGTPAESKLHDDEEGNSRQETMEEANLVDSDEELNDEKNQTTMTEDMKNQISMVNSHGSLAPTKIQINLGRDKGKFPPPAAMLRNQSSMGLPGLAQRNQELQFSKATAHQRNISLSFLNGQQVLNDITPIWEEDMKYQSQVSANPQMSSNMNNGSSSIKSFATFQKEQQPLPLVQNREESQPEQPAQELILAEEARLSNLMKSSANVTNSPSEFQDRHFRKSSNYNQVMTSLTTSIKSRSAFQEQRKLALQNSRPKSRRSSPLDSSSGRPPLYSQVASRQALPRDFKDSFVDSAFSSQPGFALAQKYEQLTSRMEPSKFKFDYTPPIERSLEATAQDPFRVETSTSCNVIETREDDGSLEETCPRLSPEDPHFDDHHRPTSNFQVIKDKLSSLLSSNEASCIACPQCQEGDVRSRSKIQITNNASGKRGVRAISFVPE